MPIAVDCFLLCTAGPRRLSRPDRGDEEERKGLYIGLKGQVNSKDGLCVSVFRGICGHQKETQQPFRLLVFFVVLAVWVLFFSLQSEELCFDCGDCSDLGFPSVIHLSQADLVFDFAKLVHERIACLQLPTDSWKMGCDAGCSAPQVIEPVDEWRVHETGNREKRSQGQGKHHAEKVRDRDKP